MSIRASGIMPLRERQSPQVRLRAALREIAREIAEGEPGRWSPLVEAYARGLIGILTTPADRPACRESVVLVAWFERRFCSRLLAELRAGDLERVRGRKASRRRA
jgi:hypothetical protein